MLETPRGEHTRPTLAKVRQALFNMLQFEIPDSRLMDAFSGSGAIGIEALSRGAAHVTFVEQHAASVRILKKNLELLKVDPHRYEIHATDVLRILSRAADPLYDFVLSDPPYSEGWEKKLLALEWESRLKPSGVLSIEWSPAVCKDFPGGALPDEAGNLKKTREKTYSDTVLTIYRLEKGE